MAFEPLYRLPDNYYDLCPYFDRDMAEEFARDFCILKMTQAIFYAMVVKNALKLGVVSRELAEHLKSSHKGLQWSMCEACLQLDKHALWLAQYHWQANPGARPELVSSKEETSMPSDAPPPSSEGG